MSSFSEVHGKLTGVNVPTQNHCPGVHLPITLVQFLEGDRFLMFRCVVRFQGLNNLVHRVEDCHGDMSLSLGIPLGGTNDVVNACIHQ